MVFLLSIIYWLTSKEEKMYNLQYIYIYMLNNLFCKDANAIVLKLWFCPDIKHGYNVQLAEGAPWSAHGNPLHLMESFFSMNEAELSPVIVLTPSFVGFKLQLYFRNYRIGNVERVFGLPAWGSYLRFNLYIMFSMFHICPIHFSC